MENIARRIILRAIIAHRGTMDLSRKKKLINYLFYNQAVAEFMYNDFYVELYKVLPKNICFSKDNMNRETRAKNYNNAIIIINNFLSNNSIYKLKLSEIYSYKNIDIIVKDVLVGFVLYLTPHINKNTGADVFLDARSVCYSKISILDVDI